MVVGVFLTFLASSFCDTSVSAKTPLIRFILTFAGIITYFLQNYRKDFKNIKDDIINSCLVNRLNDAGLDAGDYYLSLSDTIFNLLKFKDDFKTESVYERYLKMTKRVSPKHIQVDIEKLDKFAEEIYEFLKSKRE